MKYYNLFEEPDEPHLWQEGELKSCVQAAQQNDPKALEELGRRFEPLIRKIFFQLHLEFGIKWEELESAAWEYFYYFILHYEGSDEEYLTLPGLIYLRVSSRLQREYYNNNRYGITQGVDIDDENNEDIAAPDLIGKLIWNKGLKESLSALTAKERSIIEMTYFEEMKSEDIAQRLHLSGGRVRQLHQVALGKLHANLLS